MIPASTGSVTLYTSTESAEVSLPLDARAVDFAREVTAQMESREDPTLPPGRGATPCVSSVSVRDMVGKSVKDYMSVIIGAALSLSINGLLWRL
mmetsp:Transcript_3127/g.3608  ORF Transcript_3127/g.3608 Transcript_3127/m.3608 type:complete len:94 (-) Transcript_3127:116-397(-)